MKIASSTRPARNKFTLLHQLCNLIPTHLVAGLGRELGVAAKARTFSLWSHVVSLLYAQLTHALSLNDVADSLRLHRNKLAVCSAPIGCGRATTACDGVGRQR